MIRSLMLNKESYCVLDGTKYFLTDKSYSDIQGGKIVMEFRLARATTTDTTMFLFSSRVNSKTNNDRSFLINNGSFRNDIRGSRVAGDAVVAAFERYIIEQENNICNVYRKNSNGKTLLYTITSTPSSSNNSYSTNPFLIGASYNSDTNIDSRRLYGYLYSFQMFDSTGKIVRHYVPKSNSSLRDIVSGNVIHLLEGGEKYNYSIYYNYVGGTVYANEVLMGTITDVNIPVEFEHDEPEVTIRIGGSLPEEERIRGDYLRSEETWGSLGNSGDCNIAAKVSHYDFIPGSNNALVNVFCVFRLQGTRVNREYYIYDYYEETHYEYAYPIIHNLVPAGSHHYQYKVTESTYEERVLNSSKAAPYYLSNDDEITVHLSITVGCVNEFDDIVYAQAIGPSGSYKVSALLAGVSAVGAAHFSQYTFTQVASININTSNSKAKFDNITIPII